MSFIQNSDVTGPSDIVVEQEDHALVRAQRGPAHQSSLARGGGVGLLDLDVHRPLAPVKDDGRGPERFDRGVALVHETTDSATTAAMRARRIHLSWHADGRTEGTHPVVLPTKRLPSLITLHESRHLHSGSGAKCRCVHEQRMSGSSVYHDTLREASWRFPQRPSPTRSMPRSC